MVSPTTLPCESGRCRCTHRSSRATGAPSCVLNRTRARFSIVRGTGSQPTSSDQAATYQQSVTNTGVLDAGCGASAFGSGERPRSRRAGSSRPCRAVPPVSDAVPHCAPLFPQSRRISSLRMPDSLARKFGQPRKQMKRHQRHRVMGGMVGQLPRQEHEPLPHLGRCGEGRRRVRGGGRLRHAGVPCSGATLRLISTHR